MNCFHFSVSLGYKTTVDCNFCTFYTLWIAFIFQYLWDTKQRIWSRKKAKSVVNCFHFSVSLGYKTTLALELKTIDQLWIAFIFQYLWDTKQHSSTIIINLISCELLSFFSIFGIQNNLIEKEKTWLLVVNCFHFSVSLGYKTTGIEKDSFFYLLWIAFIFQYLWDTKQPRLKIICLLKGCELLSFFSIFGIQNNQKH